MTFIALEGIDRSGKATQSKILAERLRELGRRVEEVSFPDYKTVTGIVIKKYLHRELSLSPEVLQLLYAANRWERREDLELWLRKGKIVVADRYTPSGLVYGLAKGLDLDWMISIERGLPSPTLVLVVDICVETAYNREGDGDIYEEDGGLLARVRRTYLELAERFNWTIIDGERGRERVAEQLWERVKGVL